MDTVTTAKAIDVFNRVYQGFRELDDILENVASGEVAKSYKAEGFKGIYNTLELLRVLCIISDMKSLPDSRQTSLKVEGLEN